MTLKKLFYLFIPLLGILGLVYGDPELAISTKILIGIYIGVGIYIIKNKEL